MPEPENEISLYEIGAALLRRRWSIAKWMLVGVAIAGVWSIIPKDSYTSTSSFMPQRGDNNARPGLSSLAGQLGLQIADGGSGTNSPDFYADLLKSRVVLAALAVDTFTVPEVSARSATLMDILKVKASPEELRIDRSVLRLKSMIQTLVTTKTGVVQLSVRAPWPSLARAIDARLISSVNAFNLRSRQSQASAERKFTETRLDDAKSALRSAEDRLQNFIQTNRQITGSPALRFQQDRLEREVALDQQIVMSLAQAYEEVRIREVRDTPVITVIEPATLPTMPDPRRRAIRLLLGLVLGGMIGAVIAVIREISHRQRVSGDPEAEVFFRALGDAKGDAARLVPGRKSRKAK